MFSRLFSRREKDPVPHEIFDRVVTQSRRAVFYEELNIPDTVTGRYDMLSLHMFLVSNRLAAETDPRANSLSQAVFDAFTANIDDALRALGIGDSTVPKRKKQLVRQFYGHIAALAKPLDERQLDDLPAVVNARFYGGEDLGCATDLAGYLADAHEKMRAIPFGHILRGQLEFPQDIVKSAREVRN